MSKNKFTKQGVRDLNSLPATSRGKPYIPPPNQCDHGQTKVEEGGRIVCLKCGDYTHDPFAPKINQ